MTGRIRELREGRWRSNRLWWLWLRTKQLYRVLATGKQGAAALVFGVFSLIVGLVIDVTARGLMKLGPMIAIGLALLLLSAIAGGKWALHVMSPTAYAQTTVGCTESETLQLISLDIKKACEQFREQTKPFLKNSQEPTEKLKRQFAKSHGHLLRISALLDLASEQLAIPLHRLRELLLEYDPAMHRAHAREFVQNLELLSPEAARHLNLNPQHKKALEGGNPKIAARARARVRAQLDMLEYTALHSSILRMAAVHSTAQATQEYTRAVALVAKLTYEPLQHEVNWEAPERDRLHDGAIALRFLAARQRTHSGFDLNETCLNMIRMDTRVRGNSGLSRQLAGLDELGRSIDLGGDGLLLRDPTDERDFPPGRCGYFLDTVGNLQNLWQYTVKRIENDRSEVVHRFRVVYDKWTGLHSGVKKTLLVTHGFSTTVREVFKRGIPEVGANLLHQQNPPDIFIVGSGDQSDLDSRLMLSTLLEVTREERRFGRVAAGNKTTLSKLVEDDVRVMVVLGAECFDKRGRVLHPQGLEDVEWIKEKVGNDKAFSVVVVAEGYKFHEDLLAIPQAFRHLDRIQLYEPELINIIVTTDVVSAPYDPRAATRLPTCVHLQPIQRKAERRQPGRDTHILRRPVLFSHDTHRKTITPEFDLSA